MASVQSGYRQQLKLLRDDAALLDALDGRSPGAADRGEPAWTRTYGRLLVSSATSAGHSDVADVETSAPEVRSTRQPYAVVIHERTHVRQEIRTLEMYDTKPAQTADRRVVACARLGWIAETRFPTDHRLPTLREALARAGDHIVVRYRPGRRCTFRVDRPHQTFFCKVFPDDTGRRLHEEAQQLWAASERGELGFSVAEPVAWDAETRALWQRSIGGKAIGELLAGHDAPDVARRIGRAAGTIVTARLSPTSRFDGEIQCDRSHRYARELRLRVPSLTPVLDALIGTLDVVHAECGGRRVPIHGAPHMNQWLAMEGGRLGLVDFDRFSMGDPELDVATFLGELDFEEGLSCSMDDLARASIAGYEESAGPLDRRLLGAYRAHKRLAKALRTARALRPDGDVRAERHCQSAVAALAAEDRAAAMRVGSGVAVSA